MSQGINLSKIYAPPGHSDEESDFPFHEMAGNRYTEPALSARGAHDDIDEAVDNLNDELDLELASGGSSRKPINGATKSMEPFPSAPELSHQVSVFDFVRSAVQPRSFKLCNIQFSVRKRLLFFLVFLGLVAGSIDLLIREAISRISAARETFTLDQNNEWVAFTVWSSSAVALVILAIGWTHCIQQEAVGSGLPQIKTLLSGSDIPNYLSIKMLFAKVGGLIAAASSGLSIGREGPFVHISCIISHQILRLPWFAEFRQHKSFELQLIAAAAAVGVAVNFAAPIGGVLFSIEVTATYYLLDNYWKSFVSAISGALASTLLRVLFIGPEGFGQVFQTQFPVAPYQAAELPFFAILGIFMGILGGLLVQLFTIYGKLLQRTKYHGEYIRKWIVPISVILVTASVTFWAGKFMRCSLTECVNILVSEKELPQRWTDSNPYISLGTYAVVYYLLTPLSILLPVPAGVFIPAFASGAASGRLLGHLLRDYVFSAETVIYAGGYAVAGGAALAAGVTRTMSSAVIALEFTGQQNFILPVFLCVIPAYGVGELISKGLFDAILIARGLPYLPINRYDKTLTVGSIMNTHVLKLSKKTTYARILLAVNLMKRRTVPVVNESKDLLLLGAVPKIHLMKLLRKYYARNNLLTVEEDMGSPEASPTTSAAVSYVRRSIASFRSMFQDPESDRDDNNSYRQKWMPEGTLQGLQNEDMLLHFMMTSWDTSKKDIMNRQVDLVEELGKNVLAPTVLTVPKDTSLEEVHIIFVMMRCQRLYVTHQGALCGEISVEDMAKNHK